MAATAGESDASLPASMSSGSSNSRRISVAKQTPTNNRAATAAATAASYVTNAGGKTSDGV